MKAKKSAADTTLGTDPWGSEQTLFDRTVWREQAEALAHKAAAFGVMLEQVLASGSKANAELARQQAVIERLQARIYALEAELAQKKQRDEWTKARLLALSEEIETWKQNELLPST